MSENSVSRSFGIAIALLSSAVLLLLPDTVFGISGAIIMVVVFIGVGAVLRYEGLPWASIGYLLLAVSGAVLAVVGLKNHPVAIVAFFGFALAGFGFVVFEGIHEVETRSAA